jgi:prephenate dehydrogenase
VPLLAGGFRDTTRIASGSPEMWRDIVMANRGPIIEVLRGFREALDAMGDKIDRCDPDELIAMFEAAKSFRDEIPRRGIGALESDYMIIVDVADRPGVLGEITGTLGRAGINLKNINVQHVRELGGGTLLVALEKEADIERAINLLAGSGFEARER